MAELIFIPLVILVLMVAGIIAGINAARKASRLEVEMRGIRRWLKRIEDRLARLEEDVERLARGEALPKEELPEIVEEEVPERPAPEVPVEEGEEVVPKPEEVSVEDAVPAAEPPEPKEEPSVVSGAREPVVARKVHTAFAKAGTKEWWKRIEEKAGKHWITWVGAVVLFLSVGLFLKYAFEHEWLGPTGRVILGVIGGVVVVAVGERFIRRGMRPLGQGLVGGGLAILYISLYASYGIYDILPHTLTFGFMVLVTAGGMALAVAHNAVVISTLSVIGGLLTPVMLRTGQDPRDALFAYLLLLDVGVLGVAFFKRWRLLDVLAFVGTWLFFSFWFFSFYTPKAVRPATLWLVGFYLVFLFLPYVYHIRKRLTIPGERFFMAVSNAVVVLVYGFLILHEFHKNTLGILTATMSVSYLLLGSLARRRIPTDIKAVFAFIAMSVTFLTLTVPILLDLNGVTIAWAIEAPLLLYLAYKYAFLPVRLGSILPLLLAAGRIFITHSPLHTEPFTPIFNASFGTAIFVALAGAAYTVIHHLHTEVSTAIDRGFKTAVGIGSAFLALVVVHMEVWQWLHLSGNGEYVLWATALIWAAGALAFLAAGLRLRSVYTRLSGFVALGVVLFLEVWDYGEGVGYEGLMFFNGRFLAAVAGILVVFAYAVVYRRLKERCTKDERAASIPLYGIAIFASILLVSFETWQWLVAHEYHYLSRWLLPLVWVGGSAGYLGSGLKLRAKGLRMFGLVVLFVALVLTVYGYSVKSGDKWLLFFNGRFISALVVVLTFFAYSFVYRRWSRLCSKEESILSVVLHSAGILLSTLLVSTEMWLYLDPRGYTYLARCLLPIIWSAGAVGCLEGGIRLRSVHLRRMGLVLLSVAGGLAAVGYGYEIESGYILFLNGRFVAVLATLFTAFAYGFTLRRLREACGREGEVTGAVIYATATLQFLIMLSIETYLYCINTIDEPERARWVGQMSLSVLWGIYATALLSIGFWRKVRPLRLSALGLFGLTAAKLVIIDMANVKDVYRIISFFVLGMLMVGASYLYHRVEKRLQETTRKSPEKEPL